MEGREGTPVRLGLERFGVADVMGHRWPRRMVSPKLSESLYMYLIHMFHNLGALVNTVRKEKNLCWFPSGARRRSAPLFRPSGLFSPWFGTCPNNVWQLRRLSAARPSCHLALDICTLSFSPQQICSLTGHHCLSRIRKAFIATDSPGREARKFHAGTYSRYKLC